MLGGFSAAEFAGILAPGVFTPRTAGMQSGWQNGVGGRVIPDVFVLWAPGGVTLGGGLMSKWKTQTVQAGAGIGHTPPRRKREVCVGSLEWALASFWKELRRRL